MFDLKEGVEFTTNNGLKGKVVQEFDSGETVLAQLYVDGVKSNQVLYNQQGVPNASYGKQVKKNLTIQHLNTTASYMGVDLGGEDQTLIAIQYNGKTYPINVGDVTTPQQVSDIVNNLLNEIADDEMNHHDVMDSPSKPHKRPMNMTPNQQDTVQDEDNNITAMLAISGTNIVLGHTLDDEDTVFLHHEDSAEPTYMSRREATILGHMLVSIAENK